MKANTRKITHPQAAIRSERQKSSVDADVQQATAQSPDQALTMHIPNWRPLQSTDSPHARRLAQDLREHGQVNPILVTKDGLIVDGRLRYALMMASNQVPRIEYIDSVIHGVMAELLTRQASVVEQCRIALAVSQGELGPLPKPDDGTSEDTSAGTARFLADRLGWHGWKKRKVELAFQLARLSPDVLERSEVLAAKSVFGALVAAGEMERPAKTKRPTEAAMDASAARPRTSVSGSVDASRSIVVVARELLDLLLPLKEPLSDEEERILREVEDALEQRQRPESAVA